MIQAFYGIVIPWNKINYIFLAVQVRTTQDVYYSIQPTHCEWIF